VGDQHHIASRPALPDQRSHLADVLGPRLIAAEEIAERLPCLDGTEGQPRRLEAAAPRTRQHAVDHDAPHAKPLAEASRVPAALVGQIALGAAVLDPHAGRITYPGGGDRVTDQDDLATSFEESPDLLVGPDGGRRCEDDARQQEGECASHGTILAAMTIRLLTARLGSLRPAVRHGAMVLAIAAVGGVADIGRAQQAPVAPPVLRVPDVRYEPTPMEVVHVMLRLAQVGPGDVVFDLGCGDGRIVIAAARHFGARGVGVDIDPVRITESRENARQANVIDRVRFIHEDLFVTDLSDATVVTLFLSAELNLRVRPKLQRELKRGTRIVSYWHHMGDWKPQETVRLRSGNREVPIYLWTVLDRSAP